MTQFKDIELLCKQYFNLVSEIKDMIIQEEYDDALLKLPGGEKLIRKIFLAQKTVNFTPEQKQKFNAIKEKIQSDEKEMIDILIKLKDEIGLTLKNNNKKIKINNAYSITNEKQQGIFINYTD